MSSSGNCENPFLRHFLQAVKFRCSEAFVFGDPQPFYGIKKYTKKIGITVHSRMHFSVYFYLSLPQNPINNLCVSVIFSSVQSSSFSLSVLWHFSWLFAICVLNDAIHNNERRYIWTTAWRTCVTHSLLRHRVLGLPSLDYITTLYQLRKAYRVDWYAGGWLCMIQ